MLLPKAQHERHVDHTRVISKRPPPNPGRGGCTHASGDSDVFQRLPSIVAAPLGFATTLLASLAPPTTSSSPTTSSALRFLVVSFLTCPCPSRGIATGKVNYTVQAAACKDASSGLRGRYICWRYRAKGLVSSLAAGTHRVHTNCPRILNASELFGESGTLILQVVTALAAQEQSLKSDLIS